MGCRILHDSANDTAAFYCSTSMVAFGPIFSDCSVEDGPCCWDAEEAAQAFLRWLDTITTDQWRSYEPNRMVDDGRRDPRVLSDNGLQRAFVDWFTQRNEQWAREEAVAFEDA